jgi:GH15 family glucan-1,4-alpha-glucosidase
MSEEIEETEISFEEPESQEEPKVKQASSEEELDTYSKGVQSRIKKLTEKYRQEERDKGEAVRLSQQLLNENNKLKTRVKALDTGYLSEYGGRLQSQTDGAKRIYKEAYEAGDTDKMLEAQQALSNIAIQQQQYNTAKARAEQQAKMPVQQQQQAPVQQQQQQAAPVPDKKAVAWKDKNKWFGSDKIMTTAAYTIHQELVEEEGFDPNNDEYYTEVNRRMREEFPHKFAAKKSGGGSQVASAGNSASRSTKTGRRTVKLSHSAVAIAKKLGVPLEEYAKYVKD